MGIPSLIENWLAKFQYSFFNYKDGFFHVKSLTNSPQMMIDSFVKMPFMKHDKTKRILSCSTPIVNAKIHYYEIQEGLWLKVSEAENKVNFAFHNLFEDSRDDDYYFLNLHFSSMDIESKNMLVNGIPLPNNSWSVLKPRANKTLSHFKNTVHRNITLFFSKELLESKSSSLTFIQDELLDFFFSSDNQYLVVFDKDSKEHLYAEFLKLLSISDKETREIKVKEKLNQFFDSFIECYKQEKLSEEYFQLPDHDRKIIVQVERHLNENLMKSFPGIDFLANTVGISSTKLKNDFKLVHQTSIFQFYRDNQLNLAHAIIDKNVLKIKHLSSMFGYENPSKFSAAFKEKFGVLPSSLLNEK
jgi:AraC-like DNA-binding protein